MDTELLTITQAAARRGLSRSRIQTLIRDGRLPGARQVGHFWLIPAASVDALKINPRGLHLGRTARKKDTPPSENA